MRASCGQPLRLAYADPPYPTNAHLYRGHPDFAGEVDHVALLDQLTAFDGWALSTSAEALPAVLASCPPGVRIAAWVRGERPVAHRSPLSAWEPVIVCGGRAYLSSAAERRVDALVFTARPRLSDPRRVIGAKPAAFCWWMFDLLGALPGDELVDVFPGSGGVARAWELYSTRLPAIDDTSPRGSRDTSPRPPSRVGELPDASWRTCGDIKALVAATTDGPSAAVCAALGVV